MVQITLEGFDPEKENRMLDALRRKMRPSNLEFEVHLETVIRLHEEFGYSYEFINVEVPIRVGSGRQVRADIVVLHPLLERKIIGEVKNENVPLSEKVHEQASSYAKLLSADLYFLCNGREMVTRFLSPLSALFVQASFPHAFDYSISFNDPQIEKEGYVNKRQIIYPSSLNPSLKVLSSLR